MDSINKIFHVLEYMKEHILEELSLDDLCIVSGYAKAHFNYLFKFYIGETPIKYFYQLKLKHGANLLFENDNVLDIALKLGFNSHEAFTRAFKKEFGMTPMEYRGLYSKGLSRLCDLNDIEFTVAFSTSPSYRVFTSMDKSGKYYDVYQSLIDKGYISKQNLAPTIEGKQLSDKFYWDLSKIIIELSKSYNTLAELFENTIRIMYVPKLLFFNFVYDLVDMGMIKNVFLGCCGSDCFKCDILKATLSDDDELRKKSALHSKEEFNIIIDYNLVNCLGCTSNDRSESCASHCPWKPCCGKHSVTRCNKCINYPCKDITDLFSHLPEFKENFEAYNEL